MSSAERAYLSDVRSAALLGDYIDPELLALGNAFCDNRAAGQDPLSDGTSNGDGTYRFTEAAEPVPAIDAIGIDLAARQHLCP